jgi:alpha-tubulin suppressor-like RCC1 family protein
LFAATAVGFSGSHVLADTAVAWGYDSFGQLGNGTTTNSSSLVYVSGSGSGLTAIEGGEYHSLAIKNGAAYAWGYNNVGQIGNGTYTSQSSPVTVTGMSSGVTAIAGGGSHNLAIQNGAVYSWGYNIDGQLGNGTATTTSPYGIPTAAPVIGLSSGVTAIAAGYLHSLAIKSGAVYAWGGNFYGQLGNNSTTESNFPVAVNTLTSGVTAIAAGVDHSLAIQNGAAYTWGWNEHGQLGYDVPTGNSSIPLAVSGLTSGVTAIAGGEYCSLAIKDGDVYAWGYEKYGQLGNGVDSTAHSIVPIKVLDQSANFVAVAAGTASSYALSSDGSLWVWGLNDHGQLGLGDTTNRLTPTQLLAPAGYKFTAIDAGPDSLHAVALITPVVHEPGDANLDNTVDSSDFILLTQNFGRANATWAQGDFNSDGVVNALDFNILATNFGATSLSTPAQGSVVPEPASLLLLALGATSLATRRRR